MNTIILFVIIHALMLLPDPSRDGQLIVEHADRHIGRRVEGEQLRILEGNVHIRQDTLNMFCDRAVFYERREKLEFLGNVLVDNGHRELRADTIFYYPETKWADCYGNVTITGESDSLFSSRFSYDFDREFATATDDLYITDWENNVEIWGEYGTYQAAENRSLVRTNARLVRVDSSAQDSFIVTANRLLYSEDSGRMAIALDSVVILQGAMKATCDSAVYYPETEIARLFLNPFVWYEENKLEGEEMQAQFDSLELTFIRVTGEAVATSVIDSAKEKTNTLKGKIIEFTVEDREPKMIVSKMNAISIYHLEEDETDQGTNFATSDTIFIYFREGELDSIDIIGGSEGVFYPRNYKGEKAFE